MLEMFGFFGISVNMLSIILFAAGMILLLIEMFIPGFGIFGGLGLLSLILCIVFTATSFQSALIMILIIGAIIVLFAFIFARSLKKGFLYKTSIVLKHSEERNEGFVSNDDYSRLLGKAGKSVTVLRPSGIAEFDDERVDVVTDGDFIPRGTAVEVSDVAGRRVTVRLAKTANSEKSVDDGGSKISM